MDLAQLQTRLADIKLGAIRYFDSVGSTNDEAVRWVEEGAPDMSVVIADEQHSGRGRQGRTWYTPSGAALAMSIILYPTEKAGLTMPRYTALGALAVKSALQSYYGMPAQIKWPNDVLVNRRKLAGVLAEAHWSGEELKAVILGIGVNVKAFSVSEAERQGSPLLFPTTCVEAIAERPIDRIELLRTILGELVYWRERLPGKEFLQAWDASLAFRGELVEINAGQTHSMENQPSDIHEGRIIGLMVDGSLKLRAASGETITVSFGEVRLRPKPESA